MQLYPAIDIKDKKVVRLTYGDYNRVKVYFENPLDAAKIFVQSGAKNMHVVDLDGAKDGSLANFEQIRAVVEQSDLFVQVGGGIRDAERIKKYLDCGVGRVILGTVAVENFEFVRQAVRQFGDAIAVGVDAKNGFVATHGWLNSTQKNSLSFCEELRDAGVKTVIYTDISKDGAMSGTNMEVYKELLHIKGLSVIASGGITFYEELKQLSEMGIYGAILGKALYEGKIDLKKALETV